MRREPSPESRWENPFPTASLLQGSGTLALFSVIRRYYSGLSDPNKWNLFIMSYAYYLSK
jgi:hypothetical protein